nr:calcium-binding protein [Providencia sp. PROV129]
MGRIILGGRGDDTIKVFGGNNVLLGGEGENSLSGGEGHDFLLSSQGNDILMGGKGNDHYLIDGSYEGVVFIDDTEGYNHIHLVNFSGETQEEADDNGNVYRRYRSDFDKYVIVKFKSEERNTPQIHIYPQLTPKLQKLMEYNSESLIGELTKELSNTNKSGQLSTWNPVEKLHGILEGIQKPISLTPRSEYLFLDSTNSKGNWLVNTLEGDDTVNDKSGDGRIIMGDGGFKRFSADGGNNVLYGGKGESTLVAGSGDDVLISLSGDDVLNGMEGDDLYVVNGYGEGHVVIYATQGENKVILVGFDGGKLIEDKRSNGIVESTLTSNTGRVVTIYYRNHEYSDSDSVSVEFYKDNKDLWKNHSELVVDRLLQVLASSREKYENNLDMALPVHEQSNWAPTTYVESYLAKTF